MENGTRLRLLYIYQHLLKYSDADHPVSTPELWGGSGVAGGVDAAAMERGFLLELSAEGMMG